MLSSDAPEGLIISLVRKLYRLNFDANFDADFDAKLVLSIKIGKVLADTSAYATAPRAFHLPILWGSPSHPKESPRDIHPVKPSTVS